MDTLRKYLLVIYFCLTITYLADIFEIGSEGQMIMPQVIMLAYVHISVLMAFISRKWFAQLLLFTNFILIGLIPFVLGLVAKKVTNENVLRAFKICCAGIPLLFILFALLGFPQGGSDPTAALEYRFAGYRLIQAINWYSIFMYVSIYMKEEFTLDSLE